MKHVYALIIKYVIVAIILEIVLGMLTNFTLVQILWISAAVTGIAYIIGDLLILPATNNAVATICDVLLAAGTIYMFNFYYPWVRKYASLTAVAAAGIAIGFGELFFHMYIFRNVLPDHE